MVEQAGDEALGGLRQVVRVAGVVEGVLITLEQAHVGVHPGALHVLERLGHERRVETLPAGRLPNDETEGHHAVGHRQAVGVPEVDLVLARRVLVERVLDRDAHRLRSGSCVCGATR